MIRGVNKKIIEVKNTGNDYFERAILFVREQKKEISEEVLSKKANAYIISLSSFSKGGENSHHKTPPRDDAVIGTLKLITSALIGAFITAVLLIVF